MKIQIKGIKELKRKFGKLPIEIKRELNNAVKKSAYLVEGEAKPLTPVDTGRLRGSISSDIQPMRAIIAPHTKYAVAVHEGYGRHRIGERKFMTKGAQKALPKIQRIFQKAVNDALKKH